MSKQQAKQFTVVRKLWARGDLQTNILLRTESGKQCCLGFFARACGYKAREITGQANLFDLVERPDRGTKIYQQFGIDEDTHEDIVFCNDDVFIEEPEREKRLKELFASQGIEVTFED